MLQGPLCRILLMVLCQRLNRTVKCMQFYTCGLLGTLYMGYQSYCLVPVPISCIVHATPAKPYCTTVLS